MKKKSLVLFLTLALVLMAAGCGDQAKEPITLGDMQNELYKGSSADYPQYWMETKEVDTGMVFIPNNERHIQVIVIEIDDLDLTDEDTFRAYTHDLFTNQLKMYNLTEIEPTYHHFNGRDVVRIASSTKIDGEKFNFIAYFSYENNLIYNLLIEEIGNLPYDYTPEYENIFNTLDLKKVYGLDEWWEVPGQWRLKVDSVDVTDYRNEYMEKEHPEVIIVTYTYENLGYEDEYSDLHFEPLSVIDQNRELANSYPAALATYPQPTPVGAICVGAQDLFGLNNTSDFVTVIFQSYKSNGTKATGTFYVPVNK